MTDVNVDTKTKKPKLVRNNIDRALDRVDIAAESNKVYLSSENLLPPATMGGTIPMEETKTSEDIIRDKITDTVDVVTNTVLSNIKRLRIQLDALESAMINSSKNTKGALAHHIKIGSQTLRAAEQIERQIAGFSATVQDTTPNSPPDES